jgi:hypothetical protein
MVCKLFCWFETWRADILDLEGVSFGGIMFRSLEH